MRKRTKKSKNAETSKLHAERAHQAKLERQKSTWKLKACRAHLAQKRMTSSSWMSAHSHRAILKGSSSCNAGGWKKLMLALLEGEIPTSCEICRIFLQNHDFAMEAFQKDINPETSTIAWEVDGAEDSQEGVPPKLQPIQCDPFEVDTDDDDEKFEKNCAAAAEALEKMCTSSVLDKVRRNPLLEYLGAGTYKRRHPVRCQVCVRKSTGQKAIFDLITLRSEKKLRQHVDAPTHRQNVAIWKTEMLMKRQASQISSSTQTSSSPPSTQASSPQPGGEDIVLALGDVVATKKIVGMGTCEGFSLMECPENSKLYPIKDEVRLWFQYNGLRAAMPGVKGAGHHHTYHAKSGDLTIFHHKCEDSVPAVEGVPPQCVKCRGLKDDRPVVRMVSRFYLKHSAARFLVWVL